MTPRVTPFFDEATFTVSYVVAEPDGRHAAIIDPVLDYDAKAARTSTTSADAIVEHVREQELDVEWVLETHVHADHLSAGAYLREKLGGRTGIGRHVTVVQSTFARLFNTGPDFVPDGSQFDRLFSEAERFRVGAMEVEVLATPGHTPACVSYVIGDAAFVGDTLFMPDYGTARADFPGGDARSLYRSIRRILELPAGTRLFLCHDYKAPGRDHYAWETTVAAQRAANVHIRDGIGEDDFVTMRTARDRQLAMPVLMLPAVQINMRAGNMPQIESNGICYLKLPLNAL